MANIYLPNGTTEGQAAKIAEFNSDVDHAHGHKAQTAFSPGGTFQRGPALHAIRVDQAPRDEENRE